MDTPPVNPARCRLEGLSDEADPCLINNPNRPIPPEGVVTRSNTLPEEGEASWYGPDFHGQITASGEVFDTYDFTIANWTIPLGTLVRITRLGADGLPAADSRPMIARVNDRGPAVRLGRVVDLSKAVFWALSGNEGLQRGLIRVRIEQVERTDTSGDRVVVDSFRRRSEALARKWGYLRGNPIFHPNVLRVVHNPVSGNYRIVVETPIRFESSPSPRRDRPAHTPSRASGGGRIFP